MYPRAELLEKLATLQNMLVSYSRYESGNVDAAEFKSLRDELLQNPTIRVKLPRFVLVHRDFRQFWSFIKHQSASYEGRRMYICSEFAPVLDFVEHAGSPADEVVSGILSRLDAENVHRAWTRALDRRSEDPEGTITLARTLVETVCKCILDEEHVPYDEGTELPKLYRLTAGILHLAPNQHSEQIFKQILGGCQAVVEGLGAMRNKLSDAHGKGKSPARPDARHAELAANLAGAMATFLIESWKGRSDRGDCRPRRYWADGNSL
jgi:hypothetical protein